jgi:phosphoribosylformylglycinamidine synthase
MTDIDSVELFAHHEPLPLETVAVIEQGKDALVQANSTLGLALRIFLCCMTNHAK